MEYAPRGRAPWWIAPACLSALIGCGVQDPGDAPTRRLTPTEYNNTIRDLLGFDLNDEWPMPQGESFDEEEYEDEESGAWPWYFPSDVAVHGFEGIAEGQVASPYLIEQYQKAAEHFSAWTTVSPLFWACEPDGLSEDDRAACAANSIERFAQRAWRRPMTDDETARLRAFYVANVDEFGIDDGIRLTVTGVLQAPAFLYRIEPAESEETLRGGEIAPLTGWEMASRLSYFLWGSVPDAELFEAAANGDLETKKQIQAQAERMLADERAREALVHFHSQWLDLDAVYTASVDLETYASLYAPQVFEMGDSDDLGAEQDYEEFWSGILIGARAAMVREAELFVEKTVFEGGGSLGDLLTDNHGYATEIDLGDDWRSDTFQLYGITSDAVTGGTEYRYDFDDGNIGYDLRLRPVTYPADQRAGVLTLGAVMTGTSHPVHPAPVLRGLHVLERLACQSLGQPPDGAAGAAPEDTVDAHGTNRERLESITSSPECAACHDRINPAGFAFENYDSLGGWRETDNGQDVDASGSLTLTSDEQYSFTGAVDLAGQLAGSAQVHDCYALHWTRYALGRETDSADAQALGDLQSGFRDGGGDVQALLISIVTSDLFRYRRVGG